MVYDIVVLLLALGILTLGAEGLVRASGALAQRVGVSPLVAGLTLVAFATSMPELVVSIGAALSGQPDLAMGNVMGSNIFNIAVILGITALLVPIAVQWRVIRIEVPLMIAVTLGFALLFWLNAFDRWVGALLLLALVAYTVWLVVQSKRETAAGPETLPLGPLWLDLVYLLGGMGLLILGAQWMQDAAISLARRWQVSEAVIGLTIVAAGTSLPELATSVMAALRKQVDMAIGNAVGSNLFNILGILGTTTLISPLTQHQLSYGDLAMMVAVALLLWPLLYSHRTLSRIEGGALLLGYGAYLIWLWP